MAITKAGTFNGWSTLVFSPDATVQEKATVVRSTFPVGRRHRCTMTLDCAAAATPGAKGFMRAEWEPEMPKHLNKQALRQYQSGRNALYQRAANIIGGNLLLVE